MLGWEFPPHISGGLGTACAGIARGLAAAGVEVTFVVPRAHGDEDSGSTRVIGANQVAIRESAADARRAPTAAATRAPRELEAPRAAVSDRVWREIALASPLSPYLTAEGYDQASRRIAPRGALRGDERAAVAELRTELIAGDVRRIATFERARERKLDFRGSYGPDLFSEVARYALVVAELATRESFDLVHAHDWMTYPAGIAAARAASKPLVVHVHACEYDRCGEHPDERIRSLERLGLDAANRIVCVSRYTAGILRSRYGADSAKLRVVHNAVEHGAEVDGGAGAKTIDEPIVLFLGRVTFQKGPDYFLEAARRVIDVEPRVKFVVVGSGDMWPRMVERAARLGLARHVHFTGFLQGEDVARIYSMADLYVMPSVSEPFGISPLEALSLDVPVIVSRQSGVAEVLQSALKVDFWDVQEIANKILALLKYPALREHLTTNGRAEVRSMRWEDRGRALAGVYREVVA
jgi:glycosyltransferase involved in cell wall biosynthesis